jgi:hypothetical protein
MKSIQKTDNEFFLNCENNSADRVITPHKCLTVKWLIKDNKSKVVGWGIA